MKHKHDLSFNHATLDLTELDWALRHGLGMARRECERALSENQSACWNGKCSDIKSSAERLQEAATSLFTIAQTLYYVDGSHERENITFVKGTKHDS